MSAGIRKDRMHIPMRKTKNVPLIAYGARDPNRKFPPKLKLRIRQ